MGIFDKFEDAVQRATETASDAVGDVAATVDGTAEQVEEAVTSPPPPPGLTASFDGRIGDGTPAVNVGPPDIVLGDVERSDAGPAGTVRFGPVEITADVDTILPGTNTAHGGAVGGGQSITVGIDAPGIDATFTGEQAMTTSPMVIGIVPTVGGPAFGAGGEVTVHPDEMPEVAIPAHPEPPDVVVTPSPSGPIPVPYPNLQDVALDPAPLTVDLGDLGAGSVVPTSGTPDTLLRDPTYVDTPDVDLHVGEVDLGISVDPVLPGDTTVQGGVVMGGADIDVEVAAPGFEADADLQTVVEATPMVTGLVPNVGGGAVGGEVTVDVDPVDTAPPQPSELEQELQSIDDTADELDIFD